MTALEKAAKPVHIATLDTGLSLVAPAPAIGFDLLTHVGTILKTLGHPVRLKIIQYLALGKQRVSHIQAHIGLSQPATSQQLHIMADSSILGRRREGNVVHYWVANDFIWKILDYMETLSARRSSSQWNLKQIGVKSEEDLP